jgi:hypothetical protein
MTSFVGLDVSQKITVICVVDDAGRRLWRGQCPTVPEQITVLVRRHAGDDARIGIETGAMKWPFGPPHEPPRRSGRDCRRSANRVVGCRSRASPTVRSGGG